MKVLMKNTVFQEITKKNERKKKLFIIQNILNFLNLGISILILKTQQKVLLLFRSKGQNS
jgi:hypothetical protein